MTTLNLNQANKLYYGNIEVQKLYKGSNQYYPIIPNSVDILSFNPSLWLDSGDNATVLQVDGKVSQWNDKSGNNNHAIQSVAGYRPIITTDLQGNQAIKFGAFSETRLDISTLNISNEMSVFLVCQKHSEPSSPNQFFLCGASDFFSASSRCFQIASDNTIINSLVFHGAEYSYQTVNQTFDKKIFALAWKYNNTFLSVVNNIEQTFTITSQVNSLTGLRIGAATWGNSLYCRENFYKILIFPYKMTNSQVYTIINSL